VIRERQDQFMVVSQLAPEIHGLPLFSVLYLLRILAHHLYF